MECKYKTLPCLSEKAPELIDTLWNVNIVLSESGSRIPELIDTLWNVNKQEKTTCKQRRQN